MSKFDSFIPFHDEIDLPNEVHIVGGGETLPDWEYETIPTIYCGLKPFLLKNELNLPFPIYGFNQRASRKTNGERKSVIRLRPELRDDLSQLPFIAFNRRKPALTQNVYVIPRITFTEDHHPFWKAFNFRETLDGGTFQCSSGFWLSVFLIHSDIEKFYISGYDGYTTENTLKHGRIGAGPKYNHNLNDEWVYLKQSMEIAREQGKKVNLSRNLPPRSINRRKDILRCRSFKREMQIYQKRISSE
jgi:hypothetical protein